MACAAFFSDVGTSVCLVLRKTAGVDCVIHLGTRHIAAAADGPVDELCLEIHAADGAVQHCGCGGVAFHAAGHRALGNLFVPCGGALFFSWGGGFFGSPTWQKKPFVPRVKRTPKK